MELHHQAARSLIRRPHRVPKFADLFIYAPLDHEPQFVEIGPIAIPVAEQRGIGFRQRKRLSLEFTDLRGADLRNGRFDGVILQGADLEGADLTSASFAFADIRGANLTGTETSGTRFERADYDDGTRWPE